ncbi:unnamed protein product [Peniophora sp. CBMAI 1063]|nr:unnamed protein product [Peniophora sp. CBMAI 1063]
MARTKYQLPPELWSHIFGILLDEQTDVRVQSYSNIRPLADWTPLPEEVACPGCIPRCNAYTNCGARSGQAQTCTGNLARERRGLQALLHVNTAFRTLIRGARYFAQNAMTDLACRLDESRYPVQSADMIYPYTGLCLCTLPEILRRLVPGSQGPLRVRIALPSRNHHGPLSPAHSIWQVLHQYGADHLVEASFFCDSSIQPSDEDEETPAEGGELIIESTSIRRFTGWNIRKRVIVGKLLTSLRLGAEVEFYTWDRAALCRILRLCPRLETVQLLSIFDHDLRYWLIQEEPQILLEHLTCFHIQAEAYVWIGLSALLVTPVLRRAHVDVVDSLSLHLEAGGPAWSFHLARIFRRTRLSERLADIISGDDFRVDLHYECDVDEGSRGSPMPQSLPEYMSIVAADDARHHSISITIRSPMTCPLAYAPPGTRAESALSQTPAVVFEEFWTEALRRLDDLRDGQSTLSRCVHELNITGYAGLLLEFRWIALLHETYNLQRLRVHGIAGQGPALDRLLTGLCTTVSETYTDDGDTVTLDTPCGEDVTEVYLPDYPNIPRDLIQREVSLRQSSQCRSSISWFGLM